MKTIFVWMLLASSALVARAEELIDSPMYTRPNLPGPRTNAILPPEAKGLWLRALERPEADLRCKAAEAIARAHRQGFKGMETTLPSLIAALDRTDQHSAVQLGIARTLITLNSPQAAPHFLRHAQSGTSELRNLVEPALARWDYRPAREPWLQRLRDPATPYRSLVLAIEGLALVHETQAADRLREIVLSEDVAGSIRLEAARALGSLLHEGLEKPASRLAADTSRKGIVARLAAASLLRKHRSPEAITLLQGLLKDPVPSVAALAVARLMEIDPALVVPTLDYLLVHADPQLRSAAVGVLFQRPTPKHVVLLADRLDDLHTDVRTKARRSLLALATKNKDLHEPVLAEAARWLAADQWRGIEQAAILLTQLDHKPAATRLVALLPHERPEVHVTVAWGLRKLAVVETLPAVTRHVELQVRRLFGSKEPLEQSKPSLEIIDHQLSQLNQFLGQSKHLPSDPIFRQLVPKRTDRLLPEARAAAIWSLGMILEGKQDPALAKALEARLNDTASPLPEDNRVRWMSALTLGRLRAKESVPSLRNHYWDKKPSVDPVNNACGWALEQITGEIMPAPRDLEVPRSDWFLVPN